jgi:very-short-patch-repair endonuclease
VRDDVVGEVLALARGQGGVVSRRQLLAAGVPRWRTRAEVRAGRWRAHWRQTVAVHTGVLDQQAMLWAATFEGGTRSLLDGASALVASGLTGFTLPRLRVSVPRGAKVHRSRAIDVRQTRRLEPSDRLDAAGPPRVRPAVAAVRAALWARTDREAAMLIAMTVQQAIAAAEDIGRELLRVRRDRRRTLVERFVLDAMGGSHSMGELDLVRECRRRGVPVPDRQVMRRTAAGTYYLDARWWRYKVVLEIDGIHHLAPRAVVSDAVRHNEIALGGDVVLRLPVLGLRLEPDAFFDQLCRALVAGGWRGPQDVISREA